METSNEDISNKEIFAQFREWGIDLNEKKFKKLAQQYLSSFLLADDLKVDVNLSRDLGLNLMMSQTPEEYCKILWKRLLPDEKLDLFEFWLEAEEKGQEISDIDNRIQFYWDKWKTFHQYVESGIVEKQRVLSEINTDWDFYLTYMFDFIDALAEGIWGNSEYIKITNEFLASWMKYFKQFVESNEYMRDLFSFIISKYGVCLWAIGKTEAARQRFQYAITKYNYLWSYYHWAGAILTDHERGNNASLKEAATALMKARKKIRTNEFDNYSHRDYITFSERLVDLYDKHLGNKEKSKRIKDEIDKIRT